MGKRTRDAEYVGAKGTIGVIGLTTNNAVAAIFMSSLFMTFMTDYAGLGAWGASLATALLLIARLVDAIDDPIQSMIMDGAKPTKHGKYKPFFMLSIVLTTIGVIALYGLPAGITDKPAVVSVWVIFFYLVYDVGTSFFNVNLMIRTMTDDPAQRAKLVVGPRIWTMVLSMVGAAFTSIAVTLYSITGSYNKAFMILATVAIVAASVLSVIGWLMVEERHIVVPEKEEKVRLLDLIDLMKVNKPMVVNFCRELFGGFIWTLLFATPAYYIKWGMCADLTTGAVDMGKFATYSIIMSFMMIFPILVGTIIAGPIMKLFKNDPARMNRYDYILQALGGLILFVAHLTGHLQDNPAIFFGAMFIMALSVGQDFVPGSAISMEIMDYTIYKTGRDRSALSGVLSNFLAKAQTALSASLVGAILIAIGYNVDSVTGDYAGEISALPHMLTSMIIVMGLVPAVLGIIAALIMTKYPITNDVRKEMKIVLDGRSEKE